MEIRLRTVTMLSHDDLTPPFHRANFADTDVFVYQNRETTIPEFCEKRVAPAQKITNFFNMTR